MNRIRKAREFFKEVKAEWGKVTFPSRDQVISTTIVVLIASVIMAIYLWIADLLILRAYQTVLGIFN